MTWKDLKQMIEAQGVSDDTEIRYIGISVADLERKPLRTDTDDKAPGLMVWH